MIIGKLYKCVKGRASTTVHLVPGDTIIPTRVYDYQGERKGQWRKGTCIQFTKGGKASQMRLCDSHWSEYFVMVSEQK